MSKPDIRRWIGVMRATLGEIHRVAPPIPEPADFPDCPEGCDCFVNALERAQQGDARLRKAGEQLEQVVAEMSTITSTVAMLEEVRVRTREDLRQWLDAPPNKANAAGSTRKVLGK